MKSYCKQNKNINTGKIEKIEKWILDDCKCSQCKYDSYMKNIVSDIKIKKEANIQLNELTLTSKMIIKIQMEIVKKHLLNMLLC